MLFLQFLLAWSKIPDNPPLSIQMKNGSWDLFQSMTSRVVQEISSEGGRHWSTLTLRYRVRPNLPVAYIEKAVNNWNIRLISNEKLLLHWHYKLGYFFLAWIQALLGKGKYGQPPVIHTPTTSRAHYCDLSG
eukprot:15334707-Ditylum_brightwellii.AAC.1